MQQSSLTPTTHRNPHNNWRLWPHNHLLKSKHQVDLRGWNCAVCPFWESAGSGNQLRLCARRGGCCCHAAVKRTSAAYCMMMMMIHGVASCNTYCLEYLTPITSVACLRMPCRCGHTCHVPPYTNGLGSPVDQSPDKTVPGVVCACGFRCATSSNAHVLGCHECPHPGSWGAISSLTLVTHPHPAHACRSRRSRGCSPWPCRHC